MADLTGTPRFKNMSPAGGRVAAKSQDHIGLNHASVYKPNGSKTRRRRKS